MREEEMALWRKIQADIWECPPDCANPQIKGHSRVERNLRQCTEEPLVKPVKLLVVAIAPPFERGVESKIKARSATNNGQDELRRFLVERALRLPWQSLTERGFTLLHAVKCAVVPEDGHPNPPEPVVDTCARQHFAKEFKELRPWVVVTLGRMAYRAVVRAVEVIAGDRRDLSLTRPPGKALPGCEGHEVCIDDWTFTLLYAGFPLRGGGAVREETAKVVGKAATLANLEDSQNAVLA